MTLKVGDTVRLKSGGPIMTVAAVQANIVGCIWFDKTDRKTGDFIDAMLEPAQKAVGAVSVRTRR